MDTSNIDKNGSKIYNIVRLTASAAAAASNELPEAICMAMLAAAGALNVVASLVSKNEDTEAPISPDEMIFAAILTALANPGTTLDGGCMAFDPSIIHDALSAYERLKGKTPDSFLHPAMVEAARDMAASGSAVFDTFRAQREKALRGGSLN